MSSLRPILEWVEPEQCISYAAGLELQEQAFKKVQSGKIDGVIHLLEHATTITTGKNAAEELSPTVDPAIPIVQTDRGGKTTLHSPGQLVCYPVLSIETFALTPKKYVSLLEQWVINVLRYFGIEGRRDQQYPGVWVEDAKICAIGVRIDRRITRHGLALNVLNDLNLFEKIIPCGITDRSVTSLTRLGVEKDLRRIGEANDSAMTVVKKLLKDQIGNSLFNQG